MAANEPSVRALLSRGDVVAITSGRLSIKPASGEPVPDEWLLAHQERLIIEMIERTGLNAFMYASYSTGSYGKQRYPGVHLQFRCLLSDKQPYVVFNADLDRARTTKYGKQGSLLSTGQFRVRNKSAFVRFWRSSGVALPRRLAAFHGYMGNLNGIVFTGKYSRGERLDKATIQPVELPHEQILTVFHPGILMDKPWTTDGQSVDNSWTGIVDNEPAQSKSQQRFQSNLTTGGINCGIRLQGSTGIRENITSISTPVVTNKRVQDQTMDEWSNDYSNSEEI